MPASAWKGYITLQLGFDTDSPPRCGADVSHSVASTAQRLLHPPAPAALLSTCNRMMDRNEVIKGYEYEDGKYVLFDP